MKKRVSIVQQININSSVLSSIVHIGDSVTIKPRSKGLAIQRQVPIFYGNEGDLKKFPLFTDNLPEAPLPQTVYSQFNHTKNHIHVNRIRINGLSTSAVFQVGSTQNIDSESRIKHIRQFIQS